MTDAIVGALLESQAQRLALIVELLRKQSESIDRLDCELHRLAYQIDQDRSRSNHPAGRGR